MPDAWRGRLSKFITFEGGEGSGKSTQVKRLADVLGVAGIDVVTTREPGGAPGAEEIRNLLVNGDVGRWTPMTEALLNYAARLEHMERTVRPALEAGKWVISDRFADSTTAYQGYGHGLDGENIARLHRLVLGDFKPDLTIILDIDLDTGLARAASRGNGEDRYERMGRYFHERLRKGFLEIAEKEPQRCAIIDGAGDIEAVAAQVCAVVTQRLGVELP
ncbi:MAG: dTMP kinase [Rhodospirillaceae bacterium]|nr:dTMP kinase [Rhodospirillaceae bacterium]